MIPSIYRPYRSYSFVKWPTHVTRVQSHSGRPDCAHYGGAMPRSSWDDFLTLSGPAPKHILEESPNRYSSFFSLPGHCWCCWPADMLVLNLSICLGLRTIIDIMEHIYPFFHDKNKSNHATNSVSRLWLQSIQNQHFTTILTSSYHPRKTDQCFFPPDGNVISFLNGFKA